MTAPEHARDDAPDNPRPAYRRARLVLYVFVGGCLGTAARELVVLAVPAGAGIPWAVLAVNLAGALLLGLLLAVLTTCVPETPARRDIRLFAGTGVLGGFTTYSALATDTALLLERTPALGVVYAAVSVVAGLALAGLGLWLGGLAARRRDVA